MRDGGTKRGFVMKVRVLQGVKLDAETLLQAGQEVDLSEDLVRSRPDLFRSLEDLVREMERDQIQPELAEQARYEAHMAQRAMLRAGEDEAIRARAAQLAEQARVAQELATEAQRQAGQLPEAPPALPLRVVESSQSAQTETLPPHKRNRKES
jgi:hypothetical protein